MVLTGKYNELKVYPVNEITEISPGKQGIISLKIEIPDKSYIYGNPKGPGVGRPTTVEIDHPDNFTFETPQFLPPRKYKPKDDSEFVWIYENETKISLPFKIKKNSGAGEYKVSILLTALLCTEKSCTPYNFRIDYPVKIISDTPAKASRQFNIPKNTISSFLTKGNIENPANKKEEYQLYDISGFKPRFISTVNISGIIQAIIYSLLAGFLLNFMPCVLPVISIKIMDIIRYSGHNRSEIRNLGLLFTMGILVTFTFLASLMAFWGYSWGGLFQQSTFLIIMIAVVFIFALSMFDVFTINIPAFAGSASQNISNKYLQTFVKGLLATLLATPCSGPFLGGALAWASTQSPEIIFIIFICVGIGMSMPYMILTTNPKLMRFIPKPGPWMTTFENIMAFLLLGTAVYLIGILKESLIMPTLLFLLFTGIAFWQYGKFGSLIMPIKKRIISRIFLIFIITSGYFLSYNFFFGSQKESEYFESSKKDFSLRVLFENRENKRISIVDFTADWCPNCRLVEKTSLYTRKVTDSIKENNINLMIADLTEENPEAKKILTKLGSRSIPFLAVFPAGKDFYNPICLRDIYSEHDVLSAIETALKDK